MTESLQHARRAVLVCRAFHGEKPEGMTVRHLDGNNTNDRPYNLAWATQRVNQADKITHGTSLRGSRNHRTKLTEDDVRFIRAHPERAYLDLAAELGVTHGAISGVRSGKTWAWLP